jgi:hypothetical protein
MNKIKYNIIDCTTLVQLRVHQLAVLGQLCCLCHSLLRILFFEVAIFLFAKKKCTPIRNYKLIHSYLSQNILNAVKPAGLAGLRIELILITARTSVSLSPHFGSLSSFCVLCSLLHPARLSCLLVLSTRSVFLCNTCTSYIDLRALIKTTVFLCIFFHLLILHVTLHAELTGAWKVEFYTGLPQKKAAISILSIS